jgi:ABC-type nitrate/sulfonate/bicarbonate transport system permease component
MKLREELPPYQRRLIGAVSSGLLLLLWVVLTLPVLPPEEEAAPPPAPRPWPAATQQDVGSTATGSTAADAGGVAGASAAEAGAQSTAAGDSSDGTATDQGSGSPAAQDAENAIGGTGIAIQEDNSGTGQGNLDYWRQIRGQPQGRRPLVPSVILPSPWQMLAALKYLHTHEGLVRSAAASFMRITFSFLLAALVAIPLAVLMGSFGPVRAWFEPFTGPLRYLPLTAVTGLFLLLFGIEEEMKIAFLFTGSVVYLIPICVEAIQSVEDIYLETAYTLGAKPWQVVLRVLVPAAMPSIFEACRVIYGVGWTYVIVAELINAKYGLGYLISIAYKRGNIDQAYALVFVILLLGIGTNEIFRQTGKRMFAWREA